MFLLGGCEEVDKVKKKLEQKSSIGGTSFLVTIYQQENHSWQGYIQWLDTGEKMHFRSELELLNLMSKALSSNYNEGNNFRNWELLSNFDAGW